MYIPDGRLTESHIWTLKRLRETQMGLFVVCATGKTNDVPGFILEIADALIWKSLEGFDFSAYTLGLHEIAAGSPGADVLVMNDSVLGPFQDLDAALTQARWTLTGFTASSSQESHIQSYAFILKDVTKRQLSKLRSVLSLRYVHNYYTDVIYGQETRLTRVAAKSMDVGAFWYAPPPLPDPSIFAASALLDAGFPFLKRKLFGRDRKLADLDDLSRRLDGFRHPPVRC